MTKFEDKLDPQIAEALAQMPPLPVPDVEWAEIREQTRVAVASMTLPPPNPAVTRADHYVPGPDGAPDVLVRIYEPVERSQTPSAALLWMHGGGFCLGSYTDLEDFLEQMVIETGAVLVSVEYRLAPEHPFPAAPEDCYAALKWLASAADEFNINRERIAVCGGAAGGTLAAALALMTRDRGGPALYYQFLLIPALDDRLITPSSYEITDSRVWHRKAIEKMWKSYLGDANGETSPYAAPLRAADLSNLPPAYVHVEELDGLRDEGIAYANRLMQAGVRTELHVYPGTFHGSATFVPTAEVSQREMRSIFDALKRVLC